MKKNIIPKHRFQAVFGPTRPWLRLPPKRELSKEKKNHIQFIFLKISLSLLGFKPSATGHRIGYFFLILIFAKCCKCFGITKRSFRKHGMQCSSTLLNTRLEFERKSQIGKL